MRAAQDQTRAHLAVPHERSCARKHLELRHQVARVFLLLTAPPFHLRTSSRRTLTLLEAANA